MLITLLLTSVCEEEPANCFFITETAKTLMSRYMGVKPLWKKSD